MICAQKLGITNTLRFGQLSLRNINSFYADKSKKQKTNKK